MFKIGFSTIGCPDYGIDEVIRIAKMNDFSGVEFRFLRGTVDLLSLEEFSPAEVAKTRRRFEESGIEVVSIDSGVRMTSLDPEERLRQLAAAKGYLDIAEGIGAKYLRVFAGPFPETQDRGATVIAIVDGLSEIAEETLARGVTSLVETHDDFSTSESICDLYAKGASDALKVMWDTLHTYRHGESAAYTWSMLGDRIRHVHVKDAFFASPERFDFAPTGEGIVPVASFIDQLEKVDYSGYVNFEWEKGWHPEIAGPEIAFPHFAAFMRDLVQ